VYILRSNPQLKLQTHMTATPPDLPEITPTDLKARLDKGDDIVLVDVREPKEWAIADLAQYKPLRVPVAEFVERMGELDPDTEIVVYCRSGGRSGWAIKQLLAADYPRVLNLAGGILAWKDEVDPSLVSY